MHLAATILFLPFIVFLASIPFSGRLQKRLRVIYIIGGAAIILTGGGLCFYFAMYAGEQGGVTAVACQIAACLAYILFSLTIVVVDRVSSHMSAKSTK